MKKVTNIIMLLGIIALILELYAGTGEPFGSLHIINLGNKAWFISATCAILLIFHGIYGLINPKNKN